MEVQDNRSDPATDTADAPAGSGPTRRQVLLTSGVVVAAAASRQYDPSLSDDVTRAMLAVSAAHYVENWKRFARDLRKL